MLSWRVASWSDEAVVERWDRELRACRERRLLCDDWARDCGSVVFRSEGRRDSSRERYRLNVEFEDVSALLGCLSLLFMSRSSSNGSAMVDVPRM